MVSRPHCDYCGKEIDMKSFIRMEIDWEMEEASPPFEIEFCSEVCLEKTLDLGSKIIAQGYPLEKYFKEIG